MNRLKNYFTTLLTAAIALSIGSCASSLASPKSRDVRFATPEIPNSSLTTQPNSTSLIPEQATQEIPVASKPLNATNKPLKTITLTIYQADNQCQGLVPEKVAIIADNPVDKAVGKVLKKTDSGDFNLAGYRVKVNPKNYVATVDLRLPPNSKRQFISLSNCEQLALFGSLRKTLTSNEQLKIKDVRFTNQGAKISL